MIDGSFSPRALFFDLDGTLCDSDPVHERSWAEVLAPYGIDMTHERYRTTVSGRLNGEIGAMLFPDRTAAEHARIADEKEALFREMAPALKRIAGLTEFLDAASARRLPTALVTNAPRQNVDHMLRALHLSERFDIEVLAEDVGRGKPDPLPYASAAERLGVSPGDGLAFEDSGTGIRSAKTAGLMVVALATGHGEAELTAAGADLVIRDFTDERLTRLLGPQG
ncbi:HAD family hydrolase [Salinarimonas soli]|uniref:HAD family phosphatase n=1 Tax=Salinarimonas soli TaxID=1638099 RepID=A0A5B2VEU7_9HYPH|nr:HAD family phosphatase [Salinarimonas soli]KAA2237641.1 HAD family phosphatase [Salinarimonas soli]